MWLELTYCPTTLFSLKSSKSTSSAAKSLLSPSPYSVKMALLNAAVTYDSMSNTMHYFELIRDLDMRFALPKHLVVNNCFLKIQKKQRSDTRRGEWDNFQSTVAFREYLYFKGDIKIAVQSSDSNKFFARKELDFLVTQFARINYLGKRGCFVQFISASKVVELPDGYCKEFSGGQSFSQQGVLVPMDDFGEKVTFDHVNTFSTKKTIRKQRIYLFPYRVVRSSKNFTILERVR